MVERYDHLFKIILLGESAVGKTSILLRFSENTFNPDFHSTIGVDFRVSMQKYDGKNIKLQLWDTAGQERFRNIVSSYYRVANAALFIYDITNLSSFENTSLWIQDSDDFFKDKIPKFLIGNKADLEENRMVSQDRAREQASRLGMYHIEVSAKTSVNINRMFEEVTRVLMNKNTMSETGNTIKSVQKKEETCCRIM